MRAVALAILLSVTLLAGCAEPNAKGTPSTEERAVPSFTSTSAAPRPTSLGTSEAPVWVAGQSWAFDLSFVEESGGDGGRTSDTYQGRLRLDVLSNETVQGRYLVLERLESDAEHSYAALVATDPHDFSDADVTVASADACATEPCDLARAIRLGEIDAGLLRFPMHAGSSWMYTYEGVRVDADVRAAVTVSVNGTDHLAHDVRLKGAADEAGNGYSVSVRLAGRAGYAPDLGQLVSLTEDVHVDVQAGLRRQQAHVNVTAALVAAELRAPMRLHDAFELARGHALPGQGETPDLGNIEITTHPERFDAGNSWTFTATGATDPGTVHWALARIGTTPGAVALEQFADGPTFKADLDAAGRFVLLAAIVDDSGNLVDSDLELVLVDQTFEGTAACTAGVSPVIAQDEGLCGGLEFPLLMGAYRINATAAYPQGQSIVPCGGLVAYRDGEAVARSYAWPEGDARIEGIVAPRGNETWEVRWVPSASTGGEVGYAVEVRALVDEEPVAQAEACGPPLP